MGDWKLLWEAEHPSEAGYCGGYVYPQKNLAFLTYAGEVKRTGALMWQKTVLEAPAEVTAVSMERDEPLWSCEIGRQVDLTPLLGEEIFRALETRPLACNGEILLVATLFQPDVWDVHGIVVEDGSLAWTVRSREPHPYHVDTAGGWWWMTTLEGTLQRVSLQDGKERNRYSGTLEDFHLLLMGGDLLVFDETGRELRRYTGANEVPIWSLSFDAPGIEALQTRVVVSGDSLWCLETGRLRLIDRETGQELWEQNTVGGEQIFLTEGGTYLFIQDVLGGTLEVRRRETGEAVTFSDDKEFLHWGSVGGELVATSVDGELLQAESGNDNIVSLPGTAPWRLLEIAEVGGHLLATALEGEGEESPMHLVRVNDGGGVESLAKLESGVIPVLKELDGLGVLESESGFRVFCHR